MPVIRTDIVDVYIFRRWPTETAGRIEPYAEFLQLYRASGSVAGTFEGGRDAAARQDRNCTHHNRPRRCGPQAR